MTEIWVDSTICVTKAYIHLLLLKLLELVEVLKFIWSHLLLQKRDIQMFNNPPTGLYNQDWPCSSWLRREIGTTGRPAFCCRHLPFTWQGERFQQLSQLTWQTFTELQTTRGTLRRFSLHWGESAVFPHGGGYCCPVGNEKQTDPVMLRPGLPAWARDCVPQEHFRWCSPETLAQHCDGRIPGSKLPLMASVRIHETLQILLYIFSLAHYCPGMEDNFNWIF